MTTSAPPDGEYGKTAITARNIGVQRRTVGFRVSSGLETRNPRAIGAERFGDGL